MSRLPKSSPCSSLAPTLGGPVRIASRSYEESSYQMTKFEARGSSCVGRLIIIPVTASWSKALLPSGHV